MPVIPYVRQSWADGSGGATPVSAARLAVLEEGIFAAHYMPAVRVTRSTALSLPNNTETSVGFDGERFDTASNTSDTMHDNVTNNSRLTCRYAGIYDLGGMFTLASSATNTCYIKFLVNGTTPAGLAQVVGDWRSPMVGGVPWSLAVNDYVELRAFQNSGAAININAGTAEFWMVRRA